MRINLKTATSLSLILMNLTSSVYGTRFMDQTSDQDWSNPLNWSDNELPGSQANEIAYVIGGQDAYLTSPQASAAYSFDLLVGNAVAGGSLYISQDVPDLDSVRIANTNNGSVGEWIQVSGDVSAKSLTAGVGSGGEAVIYLVGGSINLEKSIILNGTSVMNIQGDDATLNATDMVLNSTSSLNLLLGEGASSPINLSDSLTIDSENAQFSVDCGFYSGGTATIELIKFKNKSGSFASDNITLEGFGGSYSGYLSEDEDSINLHIVVGSTSTTLFQNSTNNDRWSTASNWSKGVVPGASSKVIINNNRTAIVDQNLSSAIDYIMVGNNARANTLLQLEANLETNKLAIGFNSAGIGNVLQLAGEVEVNRLFEIASTTSTGNNSGSYTISGGSLSFPYAELKVGTVGPASFRIEGSEVSYIGGADLKLGSEASLEFIMDGAGVTGIRLDGNFEFEEGSSITVDATDYKGCDGYFPLIRGGSLVGDFDSSMVDLVGFGSRSPQLIVDEGLWIRLVDAPFFHTWRGQLTGLFPASSVDAVTSNNTVSINRGYSASGSLWGSVYSEAHVMGTKLSNNNTGQGGDAQSWDLRIGRGGQIYSFKNDSIGEMLSPQSYGNSPWIDSVWQGVAVDSSLNNTVGSYFIHQAGMYVGAEFSEEPFYSPMVAANTNTSSRYVSTVNWGSHANSYIYDDDKTENDFQSSLLYYNRYQDLGDGVIEVTLGIYNYGDDTMQHLNMPFGGVRRSSLDYAFLSSTDGSWSATDGDVSTFRNNEDTGGWLAYSNTPVSGDSPSLGVVYGYGDTPFEPGSESLPAYIRSNYYTNGSVAEPDDTAWRNGHLFTNIRKFNLSQGQGAWCRYYFVLGDSVTDVGEKIEARNLVAEAELTAFDYAESNSPLLGYDISGSAGDYEVVETSSSPLFYLYSYPVTGSYPIYEITEKGRATYLSESPYVTGVIKHYDGTIAGVRLLGFALSEADTNSEGSSYSYESLESILSSYTDYYKPSGEGVSVRLP